MKFDHAQICRLCSDMLYYVYFRWSTNTKVQTIPS